MNRSIYTLFSLAAAALMLVIGVALLPESPSNLGSETIGAPSGQAPSRTDKPAGMPASGSTAPDLAPAALRNVSPARLRPAAVGPDAGWPGEPNLELGAGPRSPFSPAQARHDAQQAERILEREAELLESDQDQQGATPITLAALVLPVEYGAAETLSYQVHNADGSECVTVTNRFTGPLHANIPYPGGTVTETLDNQTVYYPSTEPEDYERLIFGRTGYTEPLRAGDPMVNDGAGVDISGLTVQSYFDAQSDNTVEITGTVAPWVELPHSEAYYGIDACIPDLSPRAVPDEQLGSLTEMTIAAAEALKAKGGEFATREYWARHDQDDDGVVDGVWVIHAGRGQEYGGGSEGETAIWSRSSAIRFNRAYPNGYVIHDGDTPDEASDDIRIDRYVMLPEDSDLGVLVEEFGHSAFDLPDLYTNDASNSVGWWAPMSSGIWGGELGGSRPVNMPLWFRMVAECGGEPCGWADPVKTITYTTEPETVIIGRAGEPSGGTVEGGDYDGEIIHEGLKIDLPTQVETVPNLAGEGGGAYTGTGSGRTLTLEREIDAMLPCCGAYLHLGARWSIPRYWGYFFVEIDPDGDGEYETLPDMDGFFSDDNPFGLNEGWGLTGQGEPPTTLRFDLSEWIDGPRLQLSLRLRYITYRGGPDTGVWIDDAELFSEEFGALLRSPIDDFAAGLDGWTNSGWTAVPYTLYHPHHYLVEWRDASGFDASLLGAYQTNYHDQDEWRVDRVQANVPGALVMYRNLKYPIPGALLPQNGHAPSWGPKYGLLVVDPNFWPTQRESGAGFASSLESLDAALSLSDRPGFSLEQRNPFTGVVSATDTIEGGTSARRFDDALGYAAGLKSVDDEAPASPWDEDGSVVIPSRDGRVYSTRITDETRMPITASYGTPYVAPHFLGSGNPGDDNAALGVHIEVVDQAEDGSWGAVRVHNAAVDYRLVPTPGEANLNDNMAFSVEVDNLGKVSVDVDWEIEISGDGLPYVSIQEMQSGSFTIDPGSRFMVPVMMKFERELDSTRRSLVARVRFDDGSDTWWREAEIQLVKPSPIFLPMLQSQFEVEQAGP